MTLAEDQIHASIPIPPVDRKRVNDAVLKKVEIIAVSLSATRNLSSTEEEIEARFRIPAGTQRRWKTQLRRVYSLSSRTPLISIAFHPQLREALLYVIARKGPSDKGKIRSGKGLIIKTTEQEHAVPISEFLLKTYFRANHNATSVYMILQGHCHDGRVSKLPSGVPCSISQLPSLASVRRFLRNELKRIVPSDISNAGGTQLSVNSKLQNAAETILASVIDACKHIRRELGSKHREVIYHRALEQELKCRSIPFEHEAEFPIPYKGKEIGKDRVDFLIGHDLILEIKAKKELLSEDLRQVKSYLKNLDRGVCLLVNFGSSRFQMERRTKLHHGREGKLLH